MLKSEKKSGGRRIGSGAKKKDNKKLPLLFYIQESFIEHFGGVENCREILADFLRKNCPKC